MEMRIVWCLCLCLPYVSSWDRPSRCVRFEACRLRRENGKLTPRVLRLVTLASTAEGRPDSSLTFGRTSNDDNCVEAARGTHTQTLDTLSRGSGTGPALTGVIDQGRSSKVGC
eukprot:scaffold19661_cov49-Phaeocystis_antarctica.AAC.1